MEVTLLMEGIEREPEGRLLKFSRGLSRKVHECIAQCIAITGCTIGLFIEEVPE